VALVELLQQAHALGVDARRPALEDRLQQLGLAAEVVVHQRQVDPASWQMRRSDTPL
jgi:hypothetical protein